ncbi:hypothetical protein ACJ5NV_10825 [Loktanella agnita]|uniref:hypothetical protein n=1 Tax=Loktanella agnita TaxID=287097 RepID=UPI0039874C82
MFLGISMSAKAWAITLTIVAFAMILPFALAGQLAAAAPEPAQGVIRIVIGYISLPLILWTLHERHKLISKPLSVFFYLYKHAYLAVGLGAVAIAVLSGSGFEGGMLRFGLIVTGVALVMLWKSWKVDRQHQYETDKRYYGPEEPLDRKTLAILNAAQSRSDKPSDNGRMLDEPIRS